jgi:hypothetical protein
LRFDARLVAHVFGKNRIKLIIAGAYIRQKLVLMLARFSSKIIFSACLLAHIFDKKSYKTHARLRIVFEAHDQRAFRSFNSMYYQCLEALAEHALNILSHALHEQYKIPNVMPNQLKTLLYFLVPKSSTHIGLDSVKKTRRRTLYIMLEHLS